MPDASSFKTTRPLHAGQTTLNVSMKSGVIANSLLRSSPARKSFGPPRPFETAGAQSLSAARRAGQSRASPAEALAVLVRGDESLDHLGLVEVAAVIFELLEPEVVAVEARVGRFVGVAARGGPICHADGC